MDEFEARVIAGIGDKDLWKLRSATAIKTGHGFTAAGVLLYPETEARHPIEKAVTAVSILLQMAGELVASSGMLLSTGSHYAGAALLRQVVEIEYLTWTFKEKHRTAEGWLESTAEWRTKAFTPSQLRKTSKGRFLSKDYSNHCEEGGHPVPRGATLLGGANIPGAQVLLVDLITHSWRTWDQVLAWARDVPEVRPALELCASRVYPRLKKWGKIDPIYALMVERHPDPDRFGQPLSNET